MKAGGLLEYTTKPSLYQNLQGAVWDSERPNTENKLKTKKRKKTPQHLYNFRVVKCSLVILNRDSNIIQHSTIEQHFLINSSQW